MLGLDGVKCSDRSNSDVALTVEQGDGLIRFVGDGNGQ